MTPLFEAGPQIAVVVYLAVENEKNIAVVASAHRLIPRGRKIDDGKPAKSKSAAVIVKEVLADGIGPAVRHRVAHPLDERQIDTAAARTILPNSDDAAHITYGYCRPSGQATPALFGYFGPARMEAGRI